MLIGNLHRQSRQLGANSRLEVCEEEVVLGGPREEVLVVVEHNLRKRQSQMCKGGLKHKTGSCSYQCQ